MKSSRRLLLIGVGILAAGMMSLGIYIALGGTCWTPFTRMEIIRAEFSQLPADDSALKAWLLESRGAVDVNVQRESKAIKIVMLVKANAPELAELPAELERLGYKGMKSYDPDFREPVK
jgi:hypothetical protein